MGCAEKEKSEENKGPEIVWRHPYADRPDIRPKQIAEMILRDEIRFEPATDRLLVLVEEAPTKSQGGLYLADTARERERAPRGVILAVGPGRVLECGRVEEVPYCKGDSIQFGRYAGQRMAIGLGEDKPDSSGEQLIILQWRDVHGRWHMPENAS